MTEPRDRWDRHDWWGVVLDTDDVVTLTHFYAKLRGWRIHKLDETRARSTPERAWRI